jgi:probable addiction module antidote protein
VAAFRRESLPHLERINIVTNPALQNAGTEVEKGRMRRARVSDAAKYRDDPRAVAKYLNVALSTQDPFLITRAIGNMVRAQGVTRFSRKVGMRRDILYRMFSGEVSPAFDTVIKLLIALDIDLTAKPSVAPGPATDSKPSPDLADRTITTESAISTPTK